MHGYRRTFYAHSCSNLRFSQMMRRKSFRVRHRTADHEAFHAQWRAPAKVNDARALAAIDGGKHIPA